jgi:hypothetical protein
MGNCPVKDFDVKIVEAKEGTDLMAKGTCCFIPDWATMEHCGKDATRYMDTPYGRMFVCDEHCTKATVQ